MRYINKFNENLDDEKSIEYWCKQFKIFKYTIDENNVVNANFDINIIYQYIEKIPIKFGIIKNSSFNCYGNNLITLENCPTKVEVNFNCNGNKLTSLIGGPTEVYVIYQCRYNKLISLEGCPETISDFFFCDDNPIWQIYKLFRNHKDYLDSLDYNYLRGTNIIKLRFKEACEEAVINMPEFVYGYKYI